MAQIEPRQARLKSGAQATLRSAVPADARGLVAFARESLAGSAYLIRTPGELDPSVRRKRRWIRTMARHPDELALVAEAGGRIVGLLDTVTQRRVRVRHVTRFGLAVAPDWQGRGLGGAMLETFLAWAEAHPFIERVELHVHAENRAAIALYRRFGFLEEGRRRMAIKYEDGRYMDDLIMGLLLAERQAAAAPAAAASP